MAKEKETIEQESSEQPKPAVPKLQADTSLASEGLKMEQPAAVEHNPAEYLITGPDGLDFNVSPATYRRNFENVQGFTVKKSPTKQ